MLTIFTPTYNRAYIISKLYESLKNQTSNEFEWIIVDDDSSDNTEQLINEFEKVGYGITYVKQPHGGKHRAINKALSIARGDYFFIVDSDDYITIDAVEKINKWISEIDNPQICGVAGLRVSNNGNVWGGNPKFGDNKYIEATNLERKEYGLLGDKSEVYSTHILKEHPFPEFENEYFVTEAVVWDWIAIDGYKLRWYNEPIYVCEYLEDGLTKNGANGRIGNLKNPKGFARYVATQIKARGFKEKCELFIEYLNTARELNLSFFQRKSDLKISTVTYYKYVVCSFLYRCKRKLKQLWKVN